MRDYFSQDFIFNIQVSSFQIQNETVHIGNISDSSSEHKLYRVLSYDVIADVRYWLSSDLRGYDILVS